jgi:hypothetical protein
MQYNYYLHTPAVYVLQGFEMGSGFSAAFSYKYIDASFVINTRLLLAVLLQGFDIGSGFSSAVFSITLDATFVTYACFCFLLCAVQGFEIGSDFSGLQLPC